MTKAINYDIMKEWIKMIGDVIFFKKRDSFISKIIANITKSEFTHVGLIVAHDDLLDLTTIIESDRFIKTKLTRIKINDNHVVYSTGAKSKDVTDKILKYAYSKIGTKYDYFQILGLFLSLLFEGDTRAMFNSSNKMICSELIDLSYYVAGVKRNNSINLGNITPQELLEVYSFKDIRKEV